MAIVRGASDFEWMLDHELCLAERHRRFVSLTMIKSGSQISPKALLDGTMRNSDVYFEVDSTIGALLMSETDKAGNQMAVDRFKQACDGAVDIHFAAVCYPQDQVTARSMISTAYERLLEAEKQNRSQVPSE